MVECTCYTDGACRGNPGKSSVGIVIIHNPTKTTHKYKKYLGDKLTNNFAEYTAIIMCLEKLKRAKINSFELYADSNLAIQQINGQFKVKNENIIPLYNEVMELLKNFKDYSFTHVLRNKNKLADQLANEAIDEHNSKK